MIRRSRAIAVVALSLLFPTIEAAAVGVQRAFVASTGSDTANCQIATPCRSFGAAITKTLSGGEVIVLDSAGYGPVTVGTSVSIVAPPGVYAGISVVSGNGITVEAPAATVVLRGLSINGLGGTHGILAQHAARVQIENCVVSHMGGAAIYHGAPGGDVIVLDTIVRDNVDGVAVVSSDGQIVLDHVRSERNQNSGFYIAPVFGSIGNAFAVIVDSLFTNNRGNGIWIDTVSGAFTIAKVERSVVTNNGGDGFKVTSGAGIAQVTLGRSTIGGGDPAVDVIAPTGTVFATLSGNIVTDGRILVTGAGAVVYVSGNTGQTLACIDSPTVYVFGNNTLTEGALCGTKVGLD